MAATTNIDVNNDLKDHVPSKPLHSESRDSKSCPARCITSQSDVMTPKRARARFSERISNGISVLIKRHGYSRERASDLILKEISHGGIRPSEDEVFSAMGKLCLGMDDALRALTVANALRRVEKERGLSSSDAIEHLSSCLTVMKLLGKVESDQAQANSNHKDSPLCLKDQQMEIRGPVHNSSSKNSTFKTTTLHGTKSKLSLQSLPTVASRKRPNTDSNDKKSACDDRCNKALNAKVAKHAIADKEQAHHNADASLSRNKTSSPRTKRVAETASISGDGIQPLLSRPRLDTISTP